MSPALITQCYKFEIFIPYDFYDKQRKETVIVPSDDIMKFAKELDKKFKGVTYSNPVKGTMYSGLYKGMPDNLHYIYTLIDSKEIDPPGGHKINLSYFFRKKKQIEKKYYQNVALITFHPISILGKLN